MYLVCAKVIEPGRVDTRYYIRGVVFVAYRIQKLGVKTE